MNEHYVFQHLALHLHTWIRKYNLAGSLLFSCCLRPSFKDPAQQRDNLTESLLTPKSDFPIQLAAVNHQFIYCTIFAEECRYLLGPIRLDATITVTRQIFSDIPLFRDESWQNDVYTFDYFRYIRELRLFYGVVSSSACSEQDIIKFNCEFTGLERHIKEDLSSDLFEKQENEESHNSYLQELREQTSIEDGDLDALERSFEEDVAGSYGTLSPNLLRQHKNLGIVVITLASRSAIRGGVLPEISFSLSDTFIQKIEQTDNIDALIQIIRNAEREYTMMVREIKQRKEGLDKKMSHPKVEQTKKYIFSHLHDKLTVQELADILNINTNYLSDLFVRYEGLSLGQYILGEKINRAKNLLIYSDFSYIDIATYLGFSSQSHLGKQFKAHTGYTLKQFRDKFGVEEF